MDVGIEESIGDIRELSSSSIRPSLLRNKKIKKNRTVSFNDVREYSYALESTNTIDDEAVPSNATETAGTI